MNYKKSITPTPALDGSALPAHPNHALERVYNVGQFGRSSYIPFHKNNNYRCSFDF